ncbi:MAG: adenosylcobinamide-GDP ribazoletransferase [Halofilum sp. (in: g-proteobacteria)]|nr:adenosylcobinamide-GDP ribazoletransferase [Halofilum sp. (in: g-proteobacteria)]
MRERARAAAHDAAAAVLFLDARAAALAGAGRGRAPGAGDAVVPVVGAAVGAVGALAWWAGAALADPLSGAVAAVAATALVTGAFHEDGLADTFDGLGGSAQREGALAIMRDSRLGTYGALALMLVVLARVAALASLGALAPAALIGAHALARLAALPLIRWLPYARGDDGTGKPFAGGVTLPGLAAASAFTALLGALLWGWQLPAAALAAGAVVALLAAWFRRRLGGITGDTLGAATQLAELAADLALLAGT